MSDFDNIAIEEALKSSLGRTAIFRRYDRENKTPMNFVLDEVQRQIGPGFGVYWVDGGHPEVFCLPGFSPIPVVFSTRYLSLTAFVRRLFVEESLKGVLPDVAERTALKVIAELSLRHGDPDVAVLALVKSITGKGIWISDDDQLMALEHEPIHENYMATWFYGLLHELGHLHPAQNSAFGEKHAFSDARILAAIAASLDRFPAYPDGMKRAAIEQARQSQENSILRIDHLRTEGLADMFAASVLFKSTFEIMKRVNQKQFEVIRYVQEIVVFSNIIAVIDRCRRTAALATLTGGTRAAAFESALHPVSMMVRGMMLREYLDRAVAEYLYSKPTTRQFEDVEQLIDKINGSFSETVDTIDSGVARAMAFSLFPEHRTNGLAALDAFRIELAESPLGGAEARRFCELADSLSISGKLLTALKGILS